MIDESDSDDFFLFALFTDNPILLILLLVAGIIFGVVAISNAKKCASVRCPDGRPAQLLDHRCLCATEVRPR